MTLSKLFESSIKVLPTKTLSDLNAEAGAEQFLEITKREEEKYVPHVDYKSPGAFAKYGSASRYYFDAIRSIYNSFPFDGTATDIASWHHNAPELDKYILENLYPRTTGFARFDGNSYIDIRSGQEIKTETATDFADGVIHADINKDKHHKATPAPSSIVDVFSNHSNISCSLGEGNTVEFWLRTLGNNTSSPQPHLQTIFDICNYSPMFKASSGLTTDILHSPPAEIPSLSQVESALEPDYFQWHIAQHGENLLIQFVCNGRWVTHELVNIVSERWKHYAISFTSTRLQIYINGRLEDTKEMVVPGESISGPFQATLGHLSSLRNVMPLEAYPPLSADLDEFRFWKKARTSEEVGKYWFTQVRNTPELGVYYKFNEGIFNNEFDHNVLDYSGNISHGYWSGSPSRITGSALGVDEYKDPIIYHNHPLVRELLTTMVESGVLHDDNNNAAMYNSFPQWMTEEIEGLDKTTFANLTQIIASYFDTLHLQVTDLTKISDIEYAPPGVKAKPFAQQLLSSAGVSLPELFTDTSVLEELFARNEEKKYRMSITEVKNRIYQNLYNNLIHIFKTKGTEKCIRNVTRCFGLDEDVLKVNLYANNTQYELGDNFQSHTVKTKIVDFNHVDKNNSYIVQTSAAFPLGETITMEVETIFPTQLHGHESTFIETNIYSSTAIQVYAKRTSLSSKAVQFHLAIGDYTIFTTPVFENVYDDERWSFAIRLSDYYDNTIDGEVAKRIEFSGVSFSVDMPPRTFSLAASIDGFGIDRQVSSVLGADPVHGRKCDIKYISHRIWDKELTNKELYYHARDASNHGTFNASEDMEKCLLHWNFYNVGFAEGGSGSNITDAIFPVEDISYTSPYFPGLGQNYLSGIRAAAIDYIYTTRQQLPEIMNNSDSIQVVDYDDDKFTKGIHSTDHFWMIEKSMYQIMSQDFIALFASLQELNNFIGQPYMRFLPEYREMNQFRSQVFDRLNNVPDIEKFVKYYKWVDSAINHMLQQVMPVSANVSSNIATIIESHVLERNKYAQPLPYYKDETPVLEDELDMSSNTNSGVSLQLEHTAQGTYVETKTDKSTLLSVKRTQVFEDRFTSFTNPHLMTVPKI